MWISLDGVAVNSVKHFFSSFRECSYSHEVNDDEYAVSTAWLAKLRELIWIRRFFYKGTQWTNFPENSPAEILPPVNDWGFFYYSTQTFSRPDRWTANTRESRSILHCRVMNFPCEWICGRTCQKALLGVMNNEWDFGECRTSLALFSLPFHRRQRQIGFDGDIIEIVIRGAWNLIFANEKARNEKPSHAHATEKSSFPLHHLLIA